MRLASLKADEKPEASVVARNPLSRVLDDCTA